MKVLVDTSVWSLALRRRVNPAVPAAVLELTQLVDDGRVAMVGVIRQELLSGIREHRQFERVRDHLRAFADEAVSAEDFEHAAECFNTCRARGVQGSNTDFLLCAIAARRKYAIFSTDGDFARYAKWLPIVLYPSARK